MGRVTGKRPLRLASPTFVARHGCKVARADLIVSASLARTPRALLAAAAP